MSKFIKRILRNDTFYTITRFFNFNATKFNIKYRYMATLKKDFRERMGCEVNLDNPKTFNDKLQWLKIHYRDPIMVTCADKFAVRDYIANKIGEKYLVPLYGVWEKVNDINIERLPKQLILKTTHASGQVIICEDKSKLDWDDTLHKLQRWQHKNYYYTTGEWLYKDIPPRIIGEKLLDKNIRDYKIYCCNGKPTIVYVCEDRHTQLKASFFDVDFKFLPIEYQKREHIKNKQKPQCFAEMLEIAKILSVDFPFVRVDLYESNGKVYFGELTFIPANGLCVYEPEEWDYNIGNMIDLSLIDKKYVI